MTTQALIEKYKSKLESVRVELIDEIDHHGYSVFTDSLESQEQILEQIVLDLEQLVLFLDLEQVVRNL